MPGNLQTFTFIPADRISLVIFCILLGAMLALLFYAAAKVDRHLGRRGPGCLKMYFAIALLIFSVVVASGLPERYFIPVVPVLFATTIALCIWLALSRYGEALSRGVSLATLVAFQGFRVPLEFILHHWSELGTVPYTMAWSGQNFDIISGIVALLAAPLVNHRPRLAWLATGVGLVLLLNVMRVVVLSSPLPVSWQLERPLLLILHLPYALIVPLCVAPALIGHLLVIRRLWRQF